MTSFKSDFKHFTSISCKEDVVVTFFRNWLPGVTNHNGMLTSYEVSSYSNRRVKYTKLVCRWGNFLL